VTYLLTPDNALEITYEAETDKETVVNLTQHAYFNLSGNPDSTILNHELKILADKFVPVDPTLIPTGKLQDVKGTPFDFTESKNIGKDIETKDTQLERGKGFDHNWVLNNQDGNLAAAAELYHAPSGRLMEVHTTEPGIQFYSGNFLDGTLTGRHGGSQNFRTGLCLETQHYPDSPNQPEFPSTVLRPGEKYSSKTVFKFSTK
jgi:aldose 1-epimerase